MINQEISKPVRVAIIISHPIQHFCPQYASYAHNLKWKTKVFFASTLGVDSYEDKDFKQSIRWNNLYLDQFDHLFLNDGRNLPISTALDAPELGDALSTYNPDVVVVSGYSQKFQRRAYSWAVFNKKSIFYGADSERMQKRLWWKEAIKFLFLIKYFVNVNRVLTVGNANELYYNHYGVSLRKMTRVGFSIDLKMYQSYLEQYLVHRDVVRQRLSINNNVVVLAVVGKLVKRKRQIDLIKALLLLETLSNVEYHLLVIGSGEQLSPMEQSAMELKRNKVHFMGFTHPEQLPELYSATDIYVHPSEIEPHSLAISEAIFLGCPVILSDRCGSYGPHDDVQIGTNGLIYKCGNISGLVNCIQTLGENESLRLKFSTNSKDYAQVSQKRAHGLGLEAALIAEGFKLTS